MNKSPEYLRIETLILSKRKKMVGLSSEHHWIKIHKEVRDALVEAFKNVPDEFISQIIGFSVETIQKWKQELGYIEELKKRVQFCKRGDAKSFSNTAIIRPDVCALTKIVNIGVVAKEFGIPYGSLWRWQNAKWDEMEISGEVSGQAAVPREEIILDIAEESNEGDDMKSDPEVRQLDVFLERHKGKVRKKYSLSEKKMFLSLVERFGSKKIHDHFGVSYDTIARLKRREESELERKKRIPMRYIPVMDLMKKHPGMGPMQIRDYVRRHLGLSMGVNSVRKVMEQNGWVPPFVKTRRLTESINLYEAARKNYLWHLDFKHQYINKCKVFILFVQDDFSRFIVGHTICDGERIDVVLATIEECIRVNGKTESVMTDGGSAFFSWRGNSRFTRFLEDFGIEQLIAQTPNINGKLENLNQQAEKEVIMVTDFASVDHFKRELSKWVAFYNFLRVHQGLGNTQVPADRYYPGAKQWYGEASEQVKQQSLIAETMSTLLSELKKPK